MTLTDLANHICTQCGMNDTDDVAAALMFLQRRLEMIWNTQLWRASLIEALMTVNPDGTCNLANTVWIPSRATLLLPPEFDSVLGVRQDAHAMNVATLESYYRTDTDWLDMLGDPTEYQILKASCWEFTNPTTVKFTGGTSAATITANGVSTSQVSTVDGAQVPNVLAVLRDGTQAAIALTLADGTTVTNYTVTGAGNPLANGVYSMLNGILTNPNGCILGVPTNGGPTYPTAMQIHCPDGSYYSNDTFLGQWAGFFTVNAPHGGTTTINDTATGPTPLVAQVISTIPDTVLTTDIRQLRQRVRLTTIPQIPVNLRVLGKTTCPVLGAYDTCPINNVEPALMAFARGDMLLRQRQNGKAQIAAQEGASLLAQLATSEAFQTASRFQIQPDNGFGGDNVISQPSSLHPL